MFKEVSLEADEELEPWADWVRRATSISEEAARDYGVADGVEEQRRRKWKLAGRTARRADGRWSTALLCETAPWGLRKRGHPIRRHADDITVFHASAVRPHSCHWTCTAQDRDTWSLLEQDFVDKAVALE